MHGSGCVVKIDSIIIEEVERVPNFVQFRLGAMVVTDDNDVKTFLKVIAEGDDGFPIKEYTVAGMASHDEPAVCRDVVLDVDVFSSIRSWRVTGVICYAAADPQNRCECRPTALFALPSDLAVSS